MLIYRPSGSTTLLRHFATSLAYQPWRSYPYSRIAYRKCFVQFDDAPQHSRSVTNNSVDRGVEFGKVGLTQYFRFLSNHLPQCTLSPQPPVSVYHEHTNDPTAEESSGYQIRLSSTPEERRSPGTDPSDDTEYCYCCFCYWPR